ncbi:MAG: hypothetical protein M3Y82_07715 [Verrucomicrobiota bacterium]|nr:hypothetical protein [Verrucomicrobiota bacterium]
MNCFAWRSLGAKKQVIAQYGEDSNEVQSIGLKKKSERATPAKKITPANLA